jgi:PAS domain S-box-containing protein
LKVSKPQATDVTHDEAERLRLALEAGEIGAWHWDLATGLMDWTAQMFRNLGLEPGSSGDLYARLIAAVHPSERELADAALREFRTRLGPMRLEVRLVWPGEPHWVVFLGRVIAGNNGAPGEMLGITIDSTRRRQNEEEAAAALRESERQLRELNEELALRAEERARQLGASRAQMQAIFDNSPDWLTLFRAAADGRFIYEDMNRATEIAYGLAREQVIGRPLEEILGIEPAQLPLRLMRDCIATGQNQRYTAQRSMAGVTRSIDVMFVRVPERQDGDYRIMATARDVTDRDAIENQLRQSQKMEAVGQLTGGLAHDFNNLLTTVIGNLELLSAQVAGDPLALQYLGAAQRGAENGAKLTEQLLAFSRRQHLQPRAVDLNDVIRGMQQLLSRMIGTTISVRTILAPELWPALVDPTQIEVAILNLAINARDAMPHGGTLTIETRNLRGDSHLLPTEIAARHCICVSVRDTGTGMTEEVARSAIEPFFTTKEQGRGSGLGLSQVYGVVQQSNGAMRIESRPGAGTVVHLYLRRTAGKDAAASRTSDRPQDRQLTARVLVVDDDEEVREVTEQMLREIGYVTTGLGSGQEALDAFAHGEIPDLLVIDIAMPGLNGIETVRRAREQRSELKVLYVSGYADLGGERQTNDDPRIKKPFRLTELSAAVRAALGSGHGTQADQILSVQRR